ncbi:hypothetical protein [Deinococcus sp. RIT780]|uniref:hypothetical protein n=1 Tax=Deinococcus sp. RIT780 TaxID=2870472 RepID=UPI001C89D0A9|nr:hypothetical protein [Deinococcus sp. RIT780]MBX8465281.1 hypothetical protein [Deinococcus sp. RIT780]
MNYAAELVKILGTMLGVGIGAFAAFHFASVGRKQDVLIKERYKAIEELNGLVNELVFNARQLRSSIENFYMVSKTMPTGRAYEETIKYFNASVDTHTHAVKNNKYMLLFDEKFDKRYSDLITDYLIMITNFDSILPAIMGDEYEYARLKQGTKLSDIVKEIETLDTKFEKLIKDMVKSQKYPKI